MVTNTPPPHEAFRVQTAERDASFHLPPLTPNVLPQLKPSQPHHNINIPRKINTSYSYNYIALILWKIVPFTVLCIILKGGRASASKLAMIETFSNIMDNYYVTVLEKIQLT